VQPGHIYFPVGNGIGPMADFGDGTIVYQNIVNGSMEWGTWFNDGGFSDDYPHKRRLGKYPEKISACKGSAQDAGLLMPVNG
jgi:hypothetical protein